MINRQAALPIVRQCELLELSRSSVYYEPRPVSAADLALMRRLDQLHLAHPFLGARKLATMLKREGFAVGRRHVKTLLRRMGLEAIPQAPNEPPGPRAHALPVPALGRCHRAAEPSVGGRYHLSADGQGLSLPGGDLGPRQSQGARLAAVQYARHGLLCRGPPPSAPSAP